MAHYWYSLEKCCPNQSGKRAVTHPYRCNAARCETYWRTPYHSSAVLPPTCSPTICLLLKQDQARLQRQPLTRAAIDPTYQLLEPPSAGIVDREIGRDPKRGERSAEGCRGVCYHFYFLSPGNYTSFFEQLRKGHYAGWRSGLMPELSS